MSPTLLAGAAGGSVALVAFVAVHAIWIQPIWGMLSMLPIAALVGALAALPFDEPGMRSFLPPFPLDGIAFAGLFLLTLVPTAIIGVVVGPVDRDRITIASVVLPLLPAFAAGSFIGAAIAGAGWSAVGLGAGAFAIALTLGHNLPFFPLGSPSWEKAFGLVVLVELAGGVAFSAARALIAGATVLPAR